MYRLIQLLMVGVLLFGAVGAWWYHRAASEARANAINQVRMAVAELRTQVKYRGALGSTPINGRGLPLTIDPGWWDGPPPTNVLVPPGNPWLEVAPPGDYHLEHPRTRVVLTGEVAGLWYNPGLGVVRARVPQMVSDDDAIDLYNAVNGAAVESLFRTDADPVVKREAPAPIESEPETGIRFNPPRHAAGGDD